MASKASLVKNGIFKHENKTDKNICNIINSVDLLIIDDLGTETTNSLKNTELFNIL